MMKTPRILVIGNCLMKLNVLTDKAFFFGESVEASALGYAEGGSGTDVSVALSHLGTEALICSKTGDDTNGEKLKKYISDNKVDARFISKSKEHPTGLEISLVSNGGENSKIICNGASMAMSCDDVDEAFISYPDAVVILGGISSEGAASASKLAAEKSLPLFVMSGADNINEISESISECDIFMINENEVRAICGISPTDQEKCMKACMAIMQIIKSKYIVLRLGERGCFLYDGKYYSFISAYDVPCPSGKSSEYVFISALVSEYIASGGDIRHSCELAHTAAAVYLSCNDGDGFPTRNQIKKFICDNEIDLEIEIYDNDDGMNETEDEDSGLF